MKIDKETAEALGLDKAIGQVIKQALFLLICLGFVAYMLEPFRTGMTIFSSQFGALVADVRDVKDSVRKLGNCVGGGQVAQAKGK